MPNLWVIFLTGLTTGGLSCLAVQGGLLANVIGRQAKTEIETDEPQTSSAKPKSKHDLISYYEQHSHPKKTPRTFQKDITLSIILFLCAKVAAYTLLGFVLGWLGTMLQLTPLARGLLSLAITVFMVGTAFRLLNVHPIFNYFQIQPPKFTRTFIRRFSKSAKEDVTTPLFLGTLTVLIPCAITQAMMILAIGTGNPLSGALIMLVFTLGTSPLFFILAYFATKLGERLSVQFVRIVALLILISSLYSLESGLNLIGSPISYGAYKERLLAQNQEIEKQPTTPVETVPPPVNDQQVPEEKNLPEKQTLVINATDNGYEPRILKAKANVPVTLKLVTNDTYSCSRAFVIPSLNIQEILEETGIKTIDIPAQKSGFLRFTCSMGMYTGNIYFN